MTHLFDTSAILAHHLAESGADRVQVLFEEETNYVGICVLSFLEFEVRLREMGLSESEPSRHRSNYNPPIRLSKPTLTDPRSRKRQCHRLRHLFANRKQTLHILQI